MGVKTGGAHQKVTDLEPVSTCSSRDGGIHVIQKGSNRGIIAAIIRQTGLCGVIVSLREYSAEQ